MSVNDTLGALSYVTADLSKCASERKFVLAADLPEAIAEVQFAVHFQPQADATTRQVIGAEALLRWQHPTYGLIPPPEVVALAERVGCLPSQPHRRGAEGRPPAAGRMGPSRR